MGIQYFSLNNTTANIYHSTLMILTISTIYFLSIFAIYKEKPSRYQIQQMLTLIIGFVTFHIFIDPSVQVNVLQDDLNKDHIEKI